VSLLVKDCLVSVRRKYGARSGILSAAALIIANIGTMTAEFAGIAAAGQLFGLSRYISVPIAAVVVSALVLRGSFARVEKVFFALCAVFLAYVIAGFMSHPHWGFGIQRFNSSRRCLSITMRSISLLQHWVQPLHLGV
jgi:Mn2+/Fe2+ NRAMP family transporter